MSTRNILDWLEDASRFSPDGPAFEQPGHTITWSQVRNAARRIGSCLCTLIPQQSPVLILMEKSPDCVCSMLGAVYAGCFYTPLDATMPEARLQLIAENLRPAVVIHDEKLSGIAQRIAGEVQTLCVSDIPEMSDGLLLDERRRNHIDTDLLYVLYTSGSTGTPKGVSIAHRSVIDFVEWACEALCLPEGLRFGSQAPFYFDNSVLDIYCAMRMRGSLYLIPRGDFMFPRRLMNRLQQAHVDTIFWVPSALTALARSEVLSPGCLPEMKRVFFCGEVMPCTTLNQWKRVLPAAVYINMYGPTEITDVCTWFRVERDFSDTDSLPIGFPCANTRIWLIDGEICVGGTCLSPGYYRDLEKTAAAFIQNPNRTEVAEIIYRTGDLGEYNERGELMFLGRRDGQIKRSGYRIELGEIESALQNAADVQLACCYYDEEREKIVAAYTGSADVKALMMSLRAALPKYMLPDVLLKRDRLPRTGSGKLDRLALKLEAESEHLIP